MEYNKGLLVQLEDLAEALSPGKTGAPYATKGDVEKELLDHPHRLGHCGPEQILARSCSRVRIPEGRCPVANIERDCPQCRFRKHELCQQRIGDLSIKQ